MTPKQAKPEATAPAAVAPAPPDITNVDVALEAQTRAQVRAAESVTLSLQTETDRAARELAAIEARVALGEQGAELVPPLRTAIAEAREVLAALEDATAKFEGKRDELVQAAAMVPVDG